MFDMYVINRENTYMNKLMNTKTKEHIKTILRNMCPQINHVMVLLVESQSSDYVILLNFQLKELHAN